MAFHNKQSVDNDYIVFEALLRLMSLFMGSHKAELLARASKLDPLRSWFYFATRATSGVGSMEGKIREVNYYEFGTGWGSTLIKFVDALKSVCRSSSLSLDMSKIVLFDSFEGLPEPTDGRDRNPEWRKGLFANKESSIRTLLEWRGLSPKEFDVRFVKGYFDKTLTDELGKTLFPIRPSIITLDVDYYSSARTVFKWVRPLLLSGTYLYLDGAWDFHGDPSKGELGALNEFNGEGKGIFYPTNEFRLPELFGKTYVYIE